MRAEVVLALQAVRDIKRTGQAVYLPSSSTIFLFSNPLEFPHALAGLRRNPELDFIHQFSKRQESVKRKLALTCPLHDDQFSGQVIPKQHTAGCFVYFLSTWPTSFDCAFADAAQFDSKPGRPCFQFGALRGFHGRIVREVHGSPRSFFRVGSMASAQIW